MSRWPATVLVTRRQWCLGLSLLLWTAMAYGGQETTSPAAKLDRGFKYIHEEVRDMPWSIHILKIERSHPELEIHTAMGHGTTLGMATVAEMIRVLPPDLGKPVAAINGDYYFSRNPIYPGDPMGLQISRGELVSEPCPSRVCFWTDGAGCPHVTNVLSQFEAIFPQGTHTPIGLNMARAEDAAVLYTAVNGPSTRTRGGVDLVLEKASDGPWLPLQIGKTYKARVQAVRGYGNAPLSREVMVLSLGPSLMASVPTVAKGAVLQISTATTPDLTGVRTAIGGGPGLVHRGKAAPLSDLQGRHPRTAIGWNKDFIFFVEVDGRQRNLSIGMTFSELADYMVKLGCEEAMNLDGGGSAVMWVYGNVMNSPCEGRERAAANALVLIHKEKPPK